MDRPLVSISCITYNHNLYIRECIEGFLLQKTTFPLEILIHDDASTDGTKEIIKEYENNYPEIIKPIYEAENQWSKGRRGSMIFNFPRALGKYIALCEGDDYWIDEFKLQKQVDFLEKNERYSATVHQTELLTSEHSNKARLISPYKNDLDLDLEELIRECYFHTSSLVFRKSIFDNVSNYPSKIVSIDRALFLLCGVRGSIKYFNNNMSVYRRHNNGFSSWVTFKMIKKDLQIIPWLLQIAPSLPKNALSAYTYYSFMTNVPNNIIQLLKCYAFFSYYSLKSEIDIENMRREVMKILAWRLPTLPRKILRKLRIIKKM